MAGACVCARDVAGVGRTGEQCAAVGFGNAPADGQPQAQAVGARGVEGLEQPGALGFAQGRAVVAHGNRQVVGQVLDGNNHGGIVATGGAVGVEGVLQQVQQHLLDLLRIAPHAQALRGALLGDGNRRRLPQQAAKQGHRFADQRGRVAVGAHGGALARQRPHAGNDAGGAFGFLGDVLQRLGQCGGGQVAPRSAPLHAGGVVGNGGQRVAEFMRQRGRQLAQHRQARQVVHGLLALGQLLRQLFTLAQAAGELKGAPSHQQFDVQHVGRPQQHQRQRTGQRWPVAPQQGLWAGVAQKGIGLDLQVAQHVVDALVVGGHRPAAALGIGGQAQERQQHAAGLFVRGVGQRGKSPAGVQRGGGLAARRCIGPRTHHHQRAGGHAACALQLLQHAGAQNARIGLARQHRVGHALHRKTLDILPALKDGDSFCKTAMSRRENVPCCIDVALVYRSAIAASPLSYSQTCSTFRTAGRDGPAARTSLGAVALVHYLKDDTGLLALVFQHRLQR